MKRVRSFLSLAVLLLGSVAASAQSPALPPANFTSAGFEKMSVPGLFCQGLLGSAGFNCKRISVPAYLARAQDQSRKAIVVINGNAGGLDGRHADYARYLASNNINALVLDSFSARGQPAGSPIDVNAGRSRGLDGYNMTLDALATAEFLAASAEWKDARIGYIGESMSGSSALNLTKPFFSRTAESQGIKVRDYDAVVGLYASCIDKDARERFKAVPLLLVHPEKDDNALASDCQKQVEWMNQRGGRARISILPGEYHDFDAPWALRRAEGENSSKCASTFINGKFVLDASGKEFPATGDGYAALRASCKSNGLMSGHQGTPRVGYETWRSFFQEMLLAGGQVGTVGSAPPSSSADAVESRTLQLLEEIRAGSTTH